ncbi:hypothetical protein, partial [uncultured Ruminococcus sp.]|uniref:hypothetical protein n=1 Tax=uncultured Ruminococcus sp. TaxID=165186 RepID=UPI0025F5CF2A
GACPHHCNNADCEEWWGQAPTLQSNILIAEVIKNVVIPLTHHKNSGYTELKVLGVGRSIILLFTASLVGVLKG